MALYLVLSKWKRILLKTYAVNYLMNIKKPMRHHHRSVYITMFAYHSRLQAAHTRDQTLDSRRSAVYSGCRYYDLKRLARLRVYVNNPALLCASFKHSVMYIDGI